MSLFLTALSYSLQECLGCHASVKRTARGATKNVRFCGVVARIGVVTFWDFIFGILIAEDGVMNDFTKFQLTNGARKLVIFLFYTTLIYFSSYLINFIWIGNKKSVYDNARKSVLISIGGEVDIDKNHAKLEEIFHNNPSARWLCASTYRIHEADVEKIIDIEINKKGDLILFEKFWTEDQASFYRFTVNISENYHVNKEEIPKIGNN
jgi:hypothetical protein